MLRVPLLLPRFLFPCYPVLRGSVAALVTRLPISVRPKLPDYSLGKLLNPLLVCLFLDSPSLLSDVTPFLYQEELADR